MVSLFSSLHRCLPFTSEPRPPAAAAPTPSPLLSPTTPIPSLISLPGEVLVLLGERLCGEVATLCALTGTCREAHARRNEVDSLFAPVLGAMSARIATALAPSASMPALPLPPPHFTGSADLPSRGCSAEDAQLLKVLPTLARVGGYRDGCRRVHNLLCAMCHSRAASGLWFPLTQRGLCSHCAMAPGMLAHADRWRKQQAELEQQARRAADRTSSRAIARAVGGAMPLELRQATHQVGSLHRQSSSGGMRGGWAMPPQPSAAEGAAAEGKAGKGEADEETEEESSGQPYMELVFDSNRHGGSCIALLRAAELCVAKHSLLLIRPRAKGRAEGSDGPSGEGGGGGGGGGGGEGGCEGGGEGASTYGAFISCRWQRCGGSAAKGGFFGDERCFLFAMPSSPAHCALPAIAPATGRDANYVHASLVHGIGFGGEVGAFALGLDPDLSQANSMPSHTYRGSAALGAPSTFLVESVQLWSVYASAEEATKLRPRPRASWQEEPGVLEPGENKLMLECKCERKSNPHSYRMCGCLASPCLGSSRSLVRIALCYSHWDAAGCRHADAHAELTPCGRSPAAILQLQLHSNPPRLSPWYSVASPCLAHVCPVCALFVTLLLFDVFATFTPFFFRVLRAITTSHRVAKRATSSVRGSPATAVCGLRSALFRFFSLLAHIAALVTQHRDYTCTTCALWSSESLCGEHATVS